MDKKYLLNVMTSGEAAMYAINQEKFGKFFLLDSKQGLHFILKNTDKRIPQIKKTYKPQKKLFNQIILENFISSSLGKVISKKQKIKFYLSHKVTSVISKNNSIIVTAEDSNGLNVNFDGDYCLVSVGRKPYTNGLNLSSVGINTNDKGQIEVNDKLQTNIENIYAIGDVIKGPMLAHKAEEEGVLVAEILAKQKTQINYNLIPNVIYTWPEVASVGYTEKAAKEAGYDLKIGKFPFSASGKASAAGAKDGFVKVIYDAKYGECLGAHMIGYNVTEMIAEIVAVRKLETTAHEILKSVHPHPTMSEAVMEATAAALGEVIHM